MAMSLSLGLGLLLVLSLAWVLLAEKKEEKIQDLGYLESLVYKEEVDCYLWKDRLESYFYKDEIEDLSDFDRQRHCSFYLSTDRKIKGLLSESFDQAIKKEDVYFIEISISDDRPLFFISFLKYKKGEDDNELEVSEEAFLHQHEEYLETLDIFARAYNLTRLSFKDLEQITSLDGETCSIYHKYFDNHSQKLGLPWKEKKDE